MVHTQRLLTFAVAKAGVYASHGTCHSYVCDLSRADVDASIQDY